LGVWLTHGSAAARSVMWQTRQAALRIDPRLSRVVSFWDLVRAFPTSEDVVLFAGGWNDGCTAPLERYLLAHLIRYFRPKLFLEVGTFRGCTTRIVLDNVQDSSTIYTIDLPVDQERDFTSIPAATDERLIRQHVVGLEYRDHPRKGQIHQVFGNTFDPVTWEGIPGGVDFAFIDASHSYEAVKNDSENVGRKMDESAVIVWHDFTEGDSSERGVGQFIREQMKQRDDIFLCEATTLAIRIPSLRLRESRHRISDFFKNSSSPESVGLPAFPWLP